ncbi:hypothetical protein C0J50_9576 [Silurus asotus]|uniref:Uncharacterized protein n=1 Tax=Silurus asotus TaxID=30991 RepID=A0AAD5F9Q1_SILAS|nr:hypothetical protein C0J50_9576 [Silurus asotus]
MHESELPSGQRILCDRCPPDSHMQNNCTEIQPTEWRQRWVNLTLECLLEILKMHNNLEPQESVNGLEIFDNDQVLKSIPDKDTFIHRLHRWLSRALEEQVHKLPDQLQKAGIKKLLPKIRNRSLRILLIMMMMFLQFYSEKRQ